MSPKASYRTTATWRMASARSACTTSRRPWTARTSARSSPTSSVLRVTASTNDSLRRRRPGAGCSPGAAGGSARGRARRAAARAHRRPAPTSAIHWTASGSSDTGSPSRQRCGRRPVPVPSSGRAWVRVAGGPAPAAPAVRPPPPRGRARPAAVGSAHAPKEQRRGPRGRRVRGGRETSTRSARARSTSTTCSTTSSTTRSRRRLGARLRRPRLRAAGHRPSRAHRRRRGRLRRRQVPAAGHRPAARAAPGRPRADPRSRPG